jgi:hypothetical protein
VGRYLAVFIVVVLGGCVSEPPPPPTPMVSATDYDVLWQATREVIEKRFDVFAARKDQGMMITDYKRSEPIPAFWAKDSQNTYDTLEEIGYIVRRKAVAVISKDEQGQYTVKLTITRERQAYAPPDVVYTNAYDLYQARTTPVTEGVRYDDSLTWTKLANDSYLEAKMLGDIQKRVAKLSVTAKK